MGNDLLSHYIMKEIVFVQYHMIWKSIVTYVLLVGTISYELDNVIYHTSSRTLGLYVFL